MNTSLLIDRIEKNNPIFTKEELIDIIKQVQLASYKIGLDSARQALFIPSIFTTETKQYMDEVSKIIIRWKDEAKV